MRTAPAVSALALLALLAVACIPPPPRPPAWPSDRYSRVLVFPVRMSVSTGTPPFTTPDSELSERQGELAQQALTLVFRSRGYETVNPLDADERLGKDRELMGAVVALAGQAGFLREEAQYGSALVPGAAAPAAAEAGRGAPAPSDQGEARRLGEAFGADLLVLAVGEGEFHGLGESVLTALVSKGRQSAPPSWMRLTLVAIDPAAGAPAARLSADCGWTTDLAELAEELRRELRSIPQKR
jgi:hypothetical protein